MPDTDIKTFSSSSNSIRISRYGVNSVSTDSTGFFGSLGSFEACVCDRTKFMEKEQNTVSETKMRSVKMVPTLLGMYLSQYSTGSRNSIYSIEISFLKKKSISIFPSGTLNGTIPSITMLYPPFVRPSLL